MAAGQHSTMQVGSNAPEELGMLACGVASNYIGLHAGRLSGLSQYSGHSNCCG